MNRRVSIQFKKIFCLQETNMSTRHTRYLSSSVALELPSKEQENRQTIKELLANGSPDIEVMGCDIFDCLDIITNRDVGVLFPFGGYNSEIFFIRNENGVITPEIIYSSSWYKVSFLRRVIARGKTAPRSFSDASIMKLKRVNCVVETLMAE